MNDKIIIAIDAMGGENAPCKTIEGVSLYLKKKNNVFLIYMET
jgi:fatty acid/phospholipid biosynthesis enzyme